MLGPPGPGAGEVGENAHAHGCFQVRERGSRSEEDSPVLPPLAKGLTGWTDAFERTNIENHRNPTWVRECIAFGGEEEWRGVQHHGETLISHVKIGRVSRLFMSFFSLEGNEFSLFTHIIL